MENEVTGVKVYFKIKIFKKFKLEKGNICTIIESLKGKQIFKLFSCSLHA